MKKIQIELLIINILSFYLLIYSIFFGPIEIIPFDASRPPEPVEVPTIFFLYEFLIIFTISILVIIVDFFITRITLIILELTEIDTDLITIKGEPT